MFKLVFDHAPLGIAVLKDFKFLSEINPMLEIILDRKKEELIGKSWLDFTHPEDLEKEMDQFSRLKSGKIKGYTIEKRFQKSDGSYVWVDMSIAAFSSIGNGTDRTNPEVGKTNPGFNHDFIKHKAPAKHSEFGNNSLDKNDIGKSNVDKSDPDNNSDKNNIEKDYRNKKIINKVNPKIRKVYTTS